MKLKKQMVHRPKTHSVYVYACMCVRVHGSRLCVCVFTCVYVRVCACVYVWTGVCQGYIVLEDQITMKIQSC